MKKQYIKLFEEWSEEQTDDLRVLKHKADADGFSVLVKDGDVEVWMDVWVSDEDVNCDWNKYIFNTKKELTLSGWIPDETKIMNYQDDVDNFENVSSTAISYLEDKGLIGQDDNGNWFITGKGGVNESRRKSRRSQADTLYIHRSSIFDSSLNVYDIELFTQTLYDAGATKVWTEPAYGWSNQPEVVLFTGLDEFAAKAALEQLPVFQKWGVVIGNVADWEWSESQTNDMRVNESRRKSRRLNESKEECKVDDKVEITLKNGKVIKGILLKKSPMKIRTDSTSTQVIPDSNITKIIKIK